MPVLCCLVVVARSGACGSAVSGRIDTGRHYGAANMSQGGSRRPYSRGGPRWHPRYKDYWDYEQNYRYLHALSTKMHAGRTFIAWQAYLSESRQAGAVPFPSVLREVLTTECTVFGRPRLPVDKQLSCLCTYSYKGILRNVAWREREINMLTKYFVSIHCYFIKKMHFFNNSLIKGTFFKSC